MTKTLYEKNGRYRKLKQLLDNIEKLPLKPKSIYGYGSFFRNKEYIGDVDLYIEDNSKETRFQDFRSFFVHDVNDQPGYKEWRHKIQRFRGLIRDEWNAEHDRKESASSDGIVIDNHFYKRVVGKDLNAENFGCYVESHLDFKSKLQEFGIDCELLEYCTWSELRNFDIDCWCPGWLTLFEKMFKNRAKGIEIHSNVSFEHHDKNQPMILLWSRENPIFEENYRKWEEHKYEFVKTTYIQMVFDLQQWIECAEGEWEIKEYQRLQQEFKSEIPRDMNFYLICEKCEQLRSQMKAIVNEKILKESVRREAGDC